MKPKRFCSVLATVILCGFLSNSTARAQFTGDNETNIISGTTVNWTGTYAVGSNAVYDFLGIDSGGVLASDAGGIGVDGTDAGNDAVSVSGAGSIWSNRNDLTIGYGDTSENNSLAITTGGVVYDNNCSVAGDNNAILVSGNGSAWNNSGAVTLGGPPGQAGNSLTIAGGGVVNDGTFATAGSGGNMLLVTGPGSVWSNRNDLSLDSNGGDSLIISNGGAVYDLNGGIDEYDVVLVTGIGSVWSNRNSLSVGGQSSSLTISNGGTVYSASANLSGEPGLPLMVTGVGSVWRIDGNLQITGDQGLTIADGGVVCAGSVDNRAGITVSGGGLYVTNGLGTGELDAGNLTLNSGTLTVDRLIADSFNYVTFIGGTLNTKATMVNNGSLFTVGTGTSTAILNLDSGGSGFHSFANGLSISSNATLRGNGTVIGSVTVSQGGALAPGVSLGSITFSNSLTLALGSTFAMQLDGRAANQYDQIVTLGTVSVSNSVLSLALGYTPSVGDTYTIISNLGPNAVFGTFVNAQGDILTNNATFIAGGTTFEISYAGNGEGQDVTLTAVVREPCTGLLVALGCGGLGVMRWQIRSEA
jgi:T5SS/PEP-CTERM-associated repeat protein